MKFLLAATIVASVQGGFFTADAAGAVELDPNHPNALFRLGALNVQFGLTEDARDLFHRALDADPDHSAAAACLHRSSPGRVGFSNPTL